MTQQDQRIGIYGVLTKGDSILVVRKSRGPYKDLLDLPGGRPNHGEPLLTALEREFKEETGIEIKSFSLLGNYSFLTAYKDSENNKKELYHIALVYKIKEAKLTGHNPSIIEEDVNGSLWINKRDLAAGKCSPLLNLFR